MKIVLATYGSRGDVQPMIALSLALKSAGHDVLLVGPPEFALWAKKSGCPFLPFGHDVTAFIDSQANVVHLRCDIASLALVRRSLRLQLRTLSSIFKGADLIVGSSLMLGASTIAEFLGIPYRYIVFTPQLFPSKDHPYPAIKTQTLSPLANDFTWKAAGIADKLNLTRIINQFRQTTSLGIIKDAWDHILGEMPIAACDRAVADIPDDVDKKVIQTGYLHLDSQDVLPPELEDYIAAGDKPIYAGFGSMPVRDQEDNIPLLIKSARNVDKRIITPAFDKKQGIGKFEKDVYFIKEVPHRVLFPHTDLIIHHGGAGTTATAALSGVPQIIVPHILDQYYHGHKIYTSGLGPKSVWRKNLTVQTLTAALKKCIFNPAIRQQAKRTRALIDPENALKRAVQAIETLC